MHVELFAVDIHWKVFLLEELVKFIEMDTVFAAIFEMKMLVLSYISNHFDPFYVPTFFLRRPLLNLIQQSFVFFLKKFSLFFRKNFLSFLVDLILIFLTYGWQVL